MPSVGFQRSKTATDKVEVVRVLAKANQTGQGKWKPQAN